MPRLYRRNAAEAAAAGLLSDIPERWRRTLMRFGRTAARLTCDCRSGGRVMKHSWV
ncbi:hypothetical protein GCM10020295_47890 [Streptomyces cinereospinus]